MIQLGSDRRKTTGISQRKTDTSTDCCWKKTVSLKSMSHSTTMCSVSIREISEIRGHFLLVAAPLRWEIPWFNSLPFSAFDIL
jgi:hypothetical protein